MNLAIVIAAMFVLVYFHNGFMDFRRRCFICGGRRTHHKTCPRKEDD